MLKTPSGFSVTTTSTLLRYILCMHRY
jgi:hypothetical protein